jgi:hypothetical protein
MTSGPRCGSLFSGREAPHEVRQVGRGELPLERRRGRLVAPLEGGQALLDIGQVREVVGVSTLRWMMEK